jgi:drug/metabolite transporter (DMT)-like permease
MWFYYAIASGLFFGINSLVMRYYSKRHKDEGITSFYFSLLSAIIMLPLFLIERQISNTYVFWGGILLLGVIIVVNNLWAFKAAQLLGPSTINTILKLRLLWIVIIGFLFFNEKINWINILGMILILAATILIIDFRNWKTSKKGIILLLLVSIATAIIALFIKKMLGMAGVLSLTFLVFFVAAIINAMVIPKFIERAIKQFSSIKLIIVIAILGVLANTALIKALSYDVLASVFFIIDASFIVILFGENIWLKEKERILWKIAAVILAIVGTLLIYSA